MSGAGFKVKDRRPWSGSVVLSGLIIMVFWLMPLTLGAQETSVFDNTEDEFYREDQFYFALSYNLLSDVPQEVATRGLIGGIHFGFVRD